MHRAAYAAAAIAAAFVAWMPATAGATTELREPCPYKWQHDDGSQAPVVGCYDPAADTIYHDGQAATIWHERGHAFDHHKLTDTDRAFISSRFFRGRPWDTADPTVGDAPASERFAEFYAYCHIRQRRSSGRAVQISVGFALNPYTAKHRQFCNTVTILGLIRG